MFYPLLFLTYLALTVLIIVIAFRLIRSLQRFQIRSHDAFSEEGPSVSVCIPARNENHAMTRCLESVLASDYRKLEVVVYDDSSIDDTSTVIRSFAHAGVRFVPGVALPEGWVGKNHALQVLADEASGSLLLFMDVDTTVEPTTISQLVRYMSAEHVEMVSVIPERRDTWRLSVMCGHLRYFWQLVLSRHGMPATASALWLLERETLEQTLGGFAAHKADVAPEAHFAAQLGVHAYHCLVSSAALGVSYEKKWRSQMETSRRLLYPAVGGHWWQALLGLLALCLLNVPTVTVIVGLVTGRTAGATLGVCFLIASMAIYGVYTHASWRRGWWRGALLWPVVVFQETLVFISSVVGYARHTITWRGRLLSAPTIRVDHLEINN